MATFPPKEQPRVSDSIALAALRTAVSVSRLFVRSTLTKWGATSTVDDALLIVSELVTNAVLATGVPGEAPRWVELSKLNLIHVRLDGLNESIVISVWDTSKKVPTIKDAVDGDEGGRGLAIVDALASDWGSYPHRGGKVVWAVLPVYKRTSHGLPQRTRKPSSQAAKHEPPANADLLRRVRDGLQGL